MTSTTTDTTTNPNNTNTDTANSECTPLLVSDSSGAQGQPQQPPPAVQSLQQSPLATPIVANGASTQLPPWQSISAVPASAAAEGNGSDVAHPVDFNSDVPVSAELFQNILHDVNIAIQQGNIQPARIAQGSSGSYFCLNSIRKKVGVFKPKNEEPYGKLNPKWTKWLHRTFLPCFFGRGCLTPNTGYISEAAASVVDQHLELNIVPRTEVVAVASPSFYYPRSTLAKARRGQPLPPKVGSFQVFVNGYRDAYHYMREFNEAPMSEELKTQFRDQFERLVILDYIIRNTDRGNDNWLIKVEYPTEKSDSLEILRRKDRRAAARKQRSLAKGKAKAVSDDDDMGQVPRPHSNGLSTVNGTASPVADDTNGNNSISSSSDDDDDEEETTHLASGDQPPPNSSRSRSASNESTWENVKPQLHIAAIDNGLSFPFKHPDNWRTYPFGWTFLAAAQAPFSEATCARFLPKLIDPEFIEALIRSLRAVMEKDDEFNERVFQGQMAVLRGQVYNLTEALMRRKTPFELVQMPAITIFHEKSRSGISRRFISFRRRAPCFTGW